MNVLIVDSDGVQREQLIEVMAWFGNVEAVHQADRLSGIAGLAQRMPIDVVLVGELDGVPQTEALGALRRLLPEARRVAYNTLDPALNTRLHAAGAEITFDSRMSLWKTALVLRPLFWTAPPPVPADAYLGAYSVF